VFFFFFKLLETNPKNLKIRGAHAATPSLPLGVGVRSLPLLSLGSPFSYLMAV
jgi:hypothetical protein